VEIAQARGEFVSWFQASKHAFIEQQPHAALVDATFCSCVSFLDATDRQQWKRRFLLLKGSSLHLFAAPIAYVTEVL
jgi:hypothetical protein